MWDKPGRNDRQSMADGVAVTSTATLDRRDKLVLSWRSRSELGVNKDDRATFRGAASMPPAGPTAPDLAQERLDNGPHTVVHCWPRVGRKVVYAVLVPASAGGASGEVSASDFLFSYKNDVPTARSRILLSYLAYYVSNTVTRGRTCALEYPKQVHYHWRFRRTKDMTLK